MTVKWFFNIKRTINIADPRVLAAMLFAILFVPMLLTHAHTTAAGDIAAPVINSSLRIIHGEMPYRDFELMFGPGIVYVPALVYLIFGVNVNAQLIFAVTVNAFVGAAAFALGRRLYKNNLYAMAAALLVFYVGAPAHYIGYVYPHAFFLFLILAALFYVRHIESGAARDMFFCGIFFAAAFLFRFYETGAALLAAIMAYAVGGRHKARGFASTAGALAAFAAGLAIMLAPSLWLLRDVVGDMARSIVVDAALLGFSPGPSLPYFFSSAASLDAFSLSLASVRAGFSFSGALTAAVHAVDFADSLIIYFLPFVVLVISLWFLRAPARLKENERVFVWFFLTWGMLTMPKSLGRADLDHMSFSVTPLFFPLIFFVQKLAESAPDVRRFSRSFAALAALTAILLLAAPAFFARDIYPKLSSGRYRVATKHGTLLFDGSSDAADAAATINFIEDNTTKEDYIFATYWMAPPFYALTNRKNPAYFDSMIGLIFQPSLEKQKRICRALRDKNVKIIVHYPYWGFNSRELHFLNTCRYLNEYIESNYRLARKYGRHWIYVPLSVSL